MKVRLALFVLPAALALCFALGAAPPPADQTLRGQYRWEQGDEVGDLRAVFTPKTATTWDVAFHFDFRGAHTYRGTAEGSLEDGGSLKGDVQEDRGRRRWKFAGTFKNGKLDGQHFEQRGREEEASGTLTLFR